MRCRLATASLTALICLGALWAVGFARFNHVIRRAAPVPPRADGIVALTGGADRIETALRLLADDRAPVLLVSGVGRGTELAEMAHRVRLDPAALGARVTLGRSATDTVGNAAETAAWAQANNVRRLIVVTAGYHMPRALLEIGHALPGVALYPVPVQPPAMRGPLDFATARLLASEYDKLLAVQFGLTRLNRAGERI
ncbi:MAG: YdcF family protein [Acetobacteraceae bacterium]|nr:YdcF family protein [Acetobacteraceae bacterium]